MKWLALYAFLISPTPAKLLFTLSSFFHFWPYSLSFSFENSQPHSFLSSSFSLSRPLLVLTKLYLFLNPSCVTFLSYYHSLSNNKCRACIGTTLQSTSSLYFPIVNFTNTCLLILTPPKSFNHCNLQGLRCGSKGNPNLSTRIVLAILVQSQPSIIILHLFIHNAFSMKDVLSVLLHVINTHFCTQSMPSN